MKVIKLYMASGNFLFYTKSEIRQGEHLASQLEIVLSPEYIGDYTYNLKFKLNGETVYFTETLTPVDGVITYPIKNPVTSSAGILKLELNTSDAVTGLLAKSAVANLKVIESIDGSCEVMPEEYVPWVTVINTAVAAATEQAGLAEGYATTATQQAVIAGTKATEASGYATTAGEKAVEASGSATTASTQAGLAEEYAVTAQTKATEAEGYATTAQTKAGEASGFASTADTKATEASGYAATAGTKATEASGYAATAGTKAGEASGYAATASTQAGLASGYAATASTQAGLASGYAATASTQAGLASGYAATASTQAGLASGYAATAGTKAGEASEFALTASTKAGEASEFASTASTKAGEASEFATTADTKATEASGYAATAGTKAGEASEFATTASTKATEASGYAITADTKATEASGYAATASTKATEASGYATTAGEKATEASGYAATAGEKAVEAGQQAVISGTKATEASGYATTAGTKATEASGYAATASTKAEEAAASAVTAADATRAITAEVESARQSATKGLTFPTLDARLEAIEVDKRMYGVRRVLNATSPLLERIYDSVWKVAQVPTDDGAAVNDFDDIYPWSRIRECKIASGLVTYKGDPGYDDLTVCDWMVEIPKFYLRITQDATNRDIVVSQYNHPGFWTPQAFRTETGAELDKIYVGRFKTGKVGTSDVSRPGFLPSNNRNLAQFRTGARAKGAGWQQIDLSYVQEVLHPLYMVESATLNSQDYLGAGPTGFRQVSTDTAQLAETAVNRIVVTNAVAAFYNVGEKISIGTYSGWENFAKDRTILSKNALADGVNTEIVFDGPPTNIALGSVLSQLSQKCGQTVNLTKPNGKLSGVSGRRSNKYRGLEDIFGNVLEWVDGVLINERVAHVCRKPSLYSSTVTADYNPVGYTNGWSGYPLEMGCDENFPEARFPVSVGAGTSTGYCDKYETNNGLRVACFGGHVSGGMNAGLFCWGLSLEQTQSYQSNGSRLLFKPQS